MKKYKYTGEEPRKIIDVTGKVHFLNKGDVVELKHQPKCECIVELTESTKKKKQKVKQNGTIN